MFLIKKLIFKFMELGLGLRTCFSLDTKDPIFINFKLSELERLEVEKSLPAGFRLMPIRFTQLDNEPHYWISLNLYELKYPKKELQSIKKVRCEINTFVEDQAGRKGVFVFCDSPYVSKERQFSILGFICDFAERLVTFIYGCGKLATLEYGIFKNQIKAKLNQDKNRMDVNFEIQESNEKTTLSRDYWLFNDISFFNSGKTFDLVNVNSAFYFAMLETVSIDEVSKAKIKTPFFERSPDAVLFHRGEISYMVNSMNRSPNRILS